ncbi:lipocalin family protein [Pseudoruegeria sp. SK021]|uniref:lipocalin family protein n=1 Tax=Pseudoruegeria sp. SK021 TaxID=1933035 RepID=UPI000A21924B|nr:lipocalin family protein [Pseudoruegeria sp. SK021]OSP54393.1 hypothetical protein BV911_13010 [Pseudoruegeria sp. SK021]
MRLIPFAALLTAGFLSACAAFQSPPVSNTTVPEPRTPVDLDRYLGAWYEQARFDHSFERGCSDVSAEYALRDDGKISVLNSCVKDGKPKVTEGVATLADPGDSTKLKVSFFGPFKGDYWILDHAEDYAWSIVGEPSGRYLWILTRDKVISPETFDALAARAQGMGYSLEGLIRVDQSGPVRE